MSTNRIVDLGSIVRKKFPKKEEENNSGLDKDYVEKAFSLLDECIERTKRESINYQIWRNEQVSDLQIKSEYMTPEELEEEERKIFEFQKAHTYEILEGKFNTVNSYNKKESVQQDNSSSSTQNEYVEPTTTFIYEED